MNQHLRRLDWAWSYFERNNTKYRNDKTHWNAWCKACLRLRSAALKEEDEQLALYRQIESVRTESELFKAVLDPKDAICGKIRKLHLHLAECPYVDHQTRERAAHDQGSRRPRGIGSAALPTNNPTPLPTSITPEWFETALCRTVASAGWSWNSINDPEFTAMMKILCPGLEIPDRRVLSGRVLDAEIIRVVNSLKVKVGGKLATGMCDGWKNITRTSVIAFMITVDYLSHILHTHNVSAERKTADNLLALVLQEIAYAKDELGVDFVAWCTDASGESRSMRDKLYSLMPHLVTLDCYAHKINLVVADILKRVPEMSQVAKKANKVAKWFRNHSYALGKLRECQQEEYQKTLALVVAVITRWTAHYCAATRLIEIVKALKVCVVRHETEMLESAGPPSSEGRKAGQETFDIIKDPSFWNDLVLMKIALEPLAIAANITQNADVRLDHVLVTMCSLYYAYSQRSDIPESVRVVGQESLETRWGKADHDPFVAATYVNPCYRHHLFNPNEPGLRPLGLYSILKRLYLRFYPNEEFLVGEFIQANQMYAEAKGQFSDENMLLEELVANAKGKGGVTLLQVWGNLAAGPVSGEQQFAKLAQRLVSIVPTSVGCERLFSNMGITHTKLRNRLTTAAAQKIVQLKMNLRAGHIHDGLVSPRSPRKQIRGAATVEDIDLEDDEEVEADTSEVIDDMIDDLNADEDIRDGHEAVQTQGTEALAGHSSTHALPRIIFRWTRELTLARIFDYESLHGEKPAWKHAKTTWVEGAANLETEMAGYGLEDIVEGASEGVAASG